MKLEISELVFIDLINDMLTDLVSKQIYDSVLDKNLELGFNNLWFLILF